MGSKEYVRAKLFKQRPCKYIYLLPTNSRKQPKDLSAGFDSKVLSINFFGVEGTVHNNKYEQETGSFTTYPSVGTIKRYRNNNRRKMR